MPPGYTIFLYFRYLKSEKQQFYGRKLVATW